MSELVRSPKRAPKKRTTTVRTTFKPRAPEGKGRVLTEAEARAAVFQKLDYIRGELQDQLKAFHYRYTELAHDLKESEANRDFVRKALAGFGSRLSDVEKRLAAAGIPDLVPPPLSDPLNDWQKKIDAAVERLKELPDPCTPMQLAAHFAVPYQVIQKLWLRGRLPVTRDGQKITIAREAIAGCVRIYGVPQLRRKPKNQS